MSDELTPVPPTSDESEQQPVASENYAPARSGFWVAPITNILLGINVIVFALMVVSSGGEALFSPSGELLLKWGADYAPLTFSGEYWRVVTNIFVHIGAMHLSMNMWVLWGVGRGLEILYGSSKFLFVYLVAGIGGSLASLYWHADPVLSAGASGAVLGAFGAELAYLQFHRTKFPKDYFQGSTQSIMVLLLVNLVWGMSMPGIDNAAHIGGFITGYIAGLAVVPSDPFHRRWSIRDGFWAVVILAIIALAGYMDLRAFSVDAFRR